MSKKCGYLYNSSLNFIGKWRPLTSVVARKQTDDTAKINCISQTATKSLKLPLLNTPSPGMTGTTIYNENPY